ncbi:MAG: YbfB/YjiJ family MFS transporter [Leptospirales bacterium]
MKSSLFKDFLPSGLLGLGTAVALGFSRFDYALILPSMKSDLAMNFTEAGWLNTANAIGYLLGAIAGKPLIGRFGASTIFRSGLLLTSIAVLATGVFHSYVPLLLFRVLAGMFGALSFICGGLLAAGLFPGNAGRTSVSISIYMSGGGLGILLSGMTIPMVLSRCNDGCWTSVWIGLGFASLLCTFLSWSSAQNTEAQGNTLPGKSFWNTVSFAPLLTGYFLFGAGYIIYMTFIVAWVRNSGRSVGDVSFFWTLLGVAVILSPPIWKRVLTGWNGGKPMGAAMGITALGSLLPLLSTSFFSMIISAIFFGIAFLNVPATMTAFLQKSLPQPLWGSAIAFFTVIFSLGQIVGPVVAGKIADREGILSAGLALSFVSLLVGALVARLQREIGEIN